MSPRDLNNDEDNIDTDGNPAPAAAGNVRTGGMDSLVITGGARLEGKIKVGGAKNAALPLMCASILSDEPLILENMPKLADIATLSALLREFGIAISAEAPPKGSMPGTGQRLTLDAQRITETLAPYDIVRKMRASVLVLGPLVARAGSAKVSLPGGCAIGARPVDLHIKALEQMGAKVDLFQGYIVAEAPNGLTGADIVFPFVSVGATENALMAATLAKGRTRLMNAAREPEVTDLAECLVKMGAKIEGIGTDTLTIDGVDSLGGTTHEVLPDRIETGSFAAAAAVTGGKLELIGARADLLEAALTAMTRAGLEVIPTDSGILVEAHNGIKGTDVMTEPYPGFPTDLQAQMMTMLTVAEGASMVTETIFENRFMHVPELARMGANINLHGRSAMIRGVDHLVGAPVMATDLRASVSLVIAGLVAEGETVVNRVYHLDRGYEAIDQKLGACGAKIERVAGS